MLSIGAGSIELTITQWTVTITTKQTKIGKDFIDFLIRKYYYEDFARKY